MRLLDALHVGKLSFAGRTIEGSSAVRFSFVIAVIITSARALRRTKITLPHRRSAVTNSVLFSQLSRALISASQCGFLSLARQKFSAPTDKVGKRKGAGSVRCSSPFLSHCLCRLFVRCSFFGWPSSRERAPGNLSSAVRRAGTSGRVILARIRVVLRCETNQTGSAHYFRMIYSRSPRVADIGD